MRYLRWLWKHSSSIIMYAIAQTVVLIFVKEPHAIFLCGSIAGAIMICNDKR